MTDEIRPIRFDTSLPILVRTVIGVIGDNAFDTGRVFRDPFGRVGYVTSVSLEQEKASALERALSVALGAFAYDDGTVIGPDDFAFDRLWKAPTRWERIEVEGKDPVYVDVADRRIVGQDWLLPPADATAVAPPRLVFWSVKGGGGRSTALCVLAAHLAQDNYNVLVVDADIEAPGLGAMLLDETTRPRFGLIDFLADWGLTEWSDEALTEWSDEALTEWSDEALTEWSDEALGECVAASDLTQTSGGQGGVIDVVPAVGSVTLESPENMISKLSRAFLEKPSADGEPVTVRNQLRRFIDRMAALPGKRYDAVLIDARAGLAEISASALGLGASILVFGVNQTQTFEDFSYLFAHLSRLPVSADPDKDWRRQFRFVEAKADPQEEGKSFRENLHEVLSNHFYEVDEGDRPFTYSLDATDAPHNATRIDFGDKYKRFDPAKYPDQLRPENYSPTFGTFLKEARALLGLPEAG